MNENTAVISLVLLFCVGITRGDLLYDFIHREDPCVALCEKTPLDLKNSNYLKSCCQRGCRFFNLVDGITTLINLNSSKSVCEESCIEAYADQDRDACTTGCELMAKQRDIDYLSFNDIATKSIPISAHIEGGIDSGIILMSSDILENDMTDPGLRKELLPRWWDMNGFKLPETYIRTVPKDPWSVDYDISSDYSGETKQSMSIPGSDWLQCASRHTGIPHWILGFAIVVAALTGLWVCLSRDKTTEVPIQLVIEKSNAQRKEPLYVPNDVLWYKTPPPKFSDVVDVPDINYKA